MNTTESISTGVRPREAGGGYCGGYAIRFPEADFGEHQDQEWCEVYLDGRWRRFRFHDYARIYRLPGLYESIFYEMLECCSPTVVVRLLSEVLRDLETPMRDLRILDLGAGNGIVGEELRHYGVRRLIGADILPEAAAAAERDRPGLYDDYLVTDFTRLPEQHGDLLHAAEVNCLATVAALGFGDIPPQAFLSALSFVKAGGFVAFNIKESFLDAAGDGGFSGLVRRLTEGGCLKLQAYRRYCHRRGVAGNRLHYVAIVAQKLHDAPEGMIDPGGTTGGR